MRFFLVIAMASLLTSKYAEAQQPPAPSNDGLACFDNLAVPEFPRTALQAHVDGSVWAYVKVSPQGTVDKVDTQVVSAYGEGQKLLTPPVEAALHSAKVRPTCAGKTVTVVFRYQLHGEPTANPKPTSHKDEPNILWIESQPAASTGRG